MSQVWIWITGALAHLFAGLKLIAASLVARVLATFGLTLVSFQAILEPLKGFVLQFVSGMPANAIEMLGALGIGKGIAMILSALTVRMAWKVFIVPTAVATQLGGAS